MPTFADLVDEVLLTMEGYGLEQGRAAFINTAGGITDTDLTFTVGSTDALTEGVAEIEDELVYIQSATDPSTVTISPDGRGYRGTVAASHAANTRITMNPVLPRTLVKRKINETIIGTGPTLYGIGSQDLTYDPVTVAYELPSDVEDVLSVSYQTIGPTKAWMPVRRWSFDSHADTVAFPNGKVLNLFDGLLGVSTFRVVYRKAPSELLFDTDDLTDSGLNSTARSVVATGAAWRLVSFMDSSRLNVSSAVVDQLDERNPVGTATQVGSYLRKQYERELADEEQRQQLRTPPVMHFTD